MVSSGVAVAGNLAQGNITGAVAASVGLLGGIGGALRLASMAAKSIPKMSKIGSVLAKGTIAFNSSRAVTKVVGWQAHMPIVGKSSKLFGTHGVGVLNRGAFRVGWSRDAGRYAFRIGNSGAHRHFINIRTNIKWPGFK